MSTTKSKLDEIGQLTAQLSDAEEAISKVAYVRTTINSQIGIVFDSSKPTPIVLPTEVIVKVADIIEQHLVSDRDAIIEKASVLIK